MRKVSDVLRRICALALCLCMMAQYMPMAGFAEEGTEAAQAVEETTEPTEATTEPMEATTAPTEETTEPTEETTVPTEETTEPAEATEATEAETAGKVITGWHWVEPEEEEDRILDPETGEVYLSTTQEDPIPMELLTGALPGAILATVEGTEETVTLGPWTCEDYPAEGAYAGDYTFVTTLPEGYTLAEGVAALEVTVRFEEPEVLAGGTVSNETDLRNAINAGGNITVGADFNISRSITIGEGKNITLDLNGKTITYSGDDGSIFGASGVFTLDGGNFKVKNGTITKNGKQEYIRCFNVENGTLTIDGVTIKDFSCLKDDGAISIGSKGICNMESGTISGNSADGRKGGGVYVNQGGTFNMNGGTISGNRAQSGGGVYVYTSGTFNMYNGTISGNRAQSGGGVEVYRDGSFTMEGGEIRENQAENKSYGNGGGVAVQMGSFAMKGGTISGNRAQSGGGVYVDKNSFTMSGGTISNNTANAAGGGVYMYNGSFTMSGGSITGNGAESNGKGVYIKGIASCQLSGGARIAENTGSGTGNLYVMMGSELSITNLTTGAQLGICFSRPGDMLVATGDKQSLNYLTCENDGYVFTLKNSNELWLKRDRIKIITHPSGKGNLKYDGTSHVLVDAGTAGTGGTMLYAVGTNQPKEDAFSKNLPSGTNAGTYTVWYYAKGVGDKADSDMERLNVTIAPKSLTVTGTTVKDKTYDGTDRADIGEPGQLDGVYWKDANQVTLVQGVGHFENKDAGQQTVIFSGFDLTGDRAKNYTLTQPSPITASIEPKKLQGVLTVGDITYGEPINSSVSWSSGEEPVATDKVDVNLQYEGADGTVYDSTETPPTNAGTYTAKPFITDSNYSLQMDSVKFTIARKDITGASVTLAKPTQTYTGQELTNDVTGVTIDGLHLGEDDYTVSGDKEATDVGTYILTVTAKEKSNFTGFASATWEIQAAENKWVEEPTVTGCTYGDEPTVNVGSSKFGTVTVEYFTQDGKTSLGTDIPTNAGSYKAVFTVAETGNYNGLSMPLSFSITPADAQFTPPTPKTGLIYDGETQKLINSGSSEHGTFQYWLEGEQPGESIPQAKDAGTYAVHYQLKGDQNHKDGTAGKIDVEIAPKDITDATITLGDSLTYNGQEQRQSIASVMVDDLEVTYDVTDNTGTNAGNYTMALTGTGNFTGSISADWKIRAATDNEWTTPPTVTGWTYGETPNVTMGVAKYGTVKVNYTTKNGNTSFGETVPINAGSYKAVFTVAETGNYNGLETMVDFTIEPKNIQNASITLVEEKPQTYTGHELTNAVTGVKVDGLTLDKDDYTVAGNEKATDVGTYTLTVTGTGNFTGSASKDWKIQAVTDNDWTEKPNVTNCTYGKTPTVTMGTAKFGNVAVEYFTQDGKISFGADIPTNAGSYKAVFTVAETGNYNGLTKTVNFTISQRALTVTANPKTITYGEKPANGGVTYEGFVNGENEEVLTGTLDFAYDYAQYGNVGSYHITPKGLTSGNYDITFTKGILTVAQKDVTIQGVAVEASKVYDGTANAAITDNGRLSHNFDGENLTFHVGTAAYDDKNVGADKTVTFTGFSLEGSAAKNYRLTGQPGDVTASITQKPVELTVTVKDKVYDGTLTAELGTVTHSGFVAGDDVQLVNGTPSFSSKDKGENIPVTFTPFTLTGPDAGNYALTQPTGVKAGISPKPVTVSGITAQDKTYDGNTQVTFAYGDARLEGNLDGDKLTVTAQGSFEDANVGEKLVNITGLTLGGAERGNYVLAERGQQTSAAAAITANDRYLDLSGLDLGGDPGTVWIDGEKEPINTSGGSHILLPKEAGLLTTYTYKQNDSGDDYPVGMRVYRFRREDTGVTLTEITEFENLLNYAGCSIRLTGKKGIRMITGISQTKRSALKSAQGLAGYTLEEYGTVVMRGVGTPTLENSKSHNFAYKKGKADPIFSRVDGMIQYTNVLVGFSLDDCKDTLTLRPYIILKDTATGETVTLYGGCVCRSIYQVAQQNENTYKPGTAGYKYIHEILDYSPTAEQGGKTK